MLGLSFQLQVISKCIRIYFFKVTLPILIMSWGRKMHRFWRNDPKPADSQPSVAHDWTAFGHCRCSTAQSTPDFGYKMTIDGVLPLSSFVNAAESGADEMYPCVTFPPTDWQGMWTHGVWIKMNIRHQDGILAEKKRKKREKDENQRWFLSLHSVWNHNVLGHPSAPNQSARAHTRTHTHSRSWLKITNPRLNARIRNALM